jgi:transposase
MKSHHVLSDSEWARIEPLLPSSAGRRGHPFRDHRQVVEGIVYRLRVGMPWRELPAEFGPWQTVWKRHRRFCTDGTLSQILGCLQSEADLVAELARLASCEKTQQGPKPTECYRSADPAATQADRAPAARKLSTGAR